MSSQLDDINRKRKANDSGDTGQNGNSSGQNRRSKKNKKTKRTASGEQENPEDYVRVVPVQKTQKADLLEPIWRPVTLSKYDKAPQMQISDDRLSVTSSKGYRMARATHGVHCGTWYFEINVSHLGDTGHCRLGWATKKGELQAPVGYDEHSYGYRDVDGSKVHKALREQYGEPYRQGDVIGCLIHLPQGGRTLEKNTEDLVKWKGNLYFKHEEEPEAQELPGSLVGFFKNGVWQGVAYQSMKEGSYYPAASIYTLPEQRAGATLSFNFGPNFSHPPPASDDYPPPQAMSEKVNQQPQLDEEEE